MTQLCLVSTSLGAKGLILSEFITFTYNISLTECIRDVGHHLLVRADEVL